MYRLQDNGNHVAVIEILPDGSESPIAATNSTALAESLILVLEQYRREGNEQSETPGYDAARRHLSAEIGPPDFEYREITTRSDLA